MLIVETIGRIRREHLVKGKSIKEIARDLNKVLRSGETSFPYGAGGPATPLALGRWKAEIDRGCREDSARTADPDPDDGL
jgi:hypothetical protein